MASAAITHHFLASQGPPQWGEITNPTLYSVGWWHIGKSSTGWWKMLKSSTGWWRVIQSTIAWWKK